MERDQSNRLLEVLQDIARSLRGIHETLVVKAKEEAQLRAEAKELQAEMVKGLKEVGSGQLSEMQRFLDLDEAARLQSTLRHEDQLLMDFQKSSRKDP